MNGSRPGASDKRTDTSSRVMTIDDIAEALGVSASTVSRSISGKGNIGQATRERVLQYIKAHNFHLNSAAQGLAKSRTNNIAIILPEAKTLVEMPFFHTCMYGVEAMARERDYGLMVLITDGRNTEPLERMIGHRKVDGVLLTRTYEDDFFAAYLKEQKIPFVTIGQTGIPDVIQVDHDNRSACRDLVSMLFGFGLRRIAYLGCGMEQMVNRNRVAGYRDACSEQNPKSGPNEKLIFTELEERSQVEQAVDAMVKQKADCLVCQDDYICDIVLHRLTQKGVQIPGQMKVASCHYSRLLDNYPITVTSLKLDTSELGRKACQVLLDRLGGATVPGVTLLDYEIVAGESTSVM